ncbi:MAG: urea transporter [Tidjanibacter sp.]|nr:urea transporter [Tidjanibacter sp.]
MSKFFKTSDSDATFVGNMLRGVGQVMFQKNGWTGLFFLCGIAWGAYDAGCIEVAWGALVGTFVSTITGYLLGLDREDGDSGLWGFNGVLVGCAIMTFLESTPLTWVALILCSALTVWVRVALNNTMKGWKINSFTFPFVTSTWIFLLASRALHGMPADSLPSPHLPGYFDWSVSLAPLDLVEYWLKGIAQVFLIDSWGTGILFLIGLAVSNIWAAVWAAIGSAVALAGAILFGAPGEMISEGLFGFSSVLTAIALGATFYRPSWGSAIWSLLGIVVCMFVQLATDLWLEPIGLPALTAPFCLTTWIFLLPLFKFGKHKHPVDHSDWHKKREVTADTTATKNE